MYVQRPKYLSHLPLPPWVHRQEIGLDTEQPGLKLVPPLDASGSPRTVPLPGGIVSVLERSNLSSPLAHELCQPGLSDTAVHYYSVFKYSFQTTLLWQAFLWHVLNTNLGRRELFCSQDFMRLSKFSTSMGNFHIFSAF